MATEWTKEVESRRIGEDTRSEFERDVDRVKYNYYYRRLADVTQVSSGSGSVLHHNRLTHSEKVAQVARRLAEYLKHDPANEPGITAAGGLDRNVVTAAGLLHDIGHPPFGHIAEEQLDKIARAEGLDDGYEGNAQTLRIILSLTAHKERDKDPHVKATLNQGLELTRAVVAACAKYPWPWDSEKAQEHHKWGYYVPEEARFKDFVKRVLPDDEVPTLEATIMDLADDITYAVHDLQDYYLDRIIPLHALKHDSRGNGYEPVNYHEWRRFWGYVTVKLQRTKGLVPSVQAEDLFARYASEFPTRPFEGTLAEEAQIGALASQIITDASKATSVRSDGTLYCREDMQAVVFALKEVTWYFVIDSPDLIKVQISQRAKIDEVYGRLYKWVERSYRKADAASNADERWLHLRRLPVRLNEFIDALLKGKEGAPVYSTQKQCYVRAVIDYIASMTEREFNRLWLELCAGEHYKASDSRYEHGE